MMKNEQSHKQKYRVPYQECKIHSEKLNYICVDPLCHENSLICSICREDPKHDKHTIRPLKFYMEELQEKYLKSPLESGLHEMLQDIELKQFKFYEKLKKSVEDIAEQFRILEEEVNERFNQIKSEIHEEISKRNRFKEFHESLKKGDVDLSNFLIQSYLPQASVGNISNLENLTKLSEEVCERIQEVKGSIFSRQATDNIKWEKKEKNINNTFNLLDLKIALKIPKNIYFDGAVLTQNQILGGSKSVCLINYPIANLSGKLMFKLLQLKKGGSFIVGVISESVYNSMNELWAINKLDNRSYVLGSDGYSKGWDKKEITQFGQGSTLELSYRSGELKLSQKSKSCAVKMPNNPDLFVFIALCGDTQVRVSHMK